MKRAPTWPAGSLSSRLPSCSCQRSKPLGAVSPMRPLSRRRITPCELPSAPRTRYSRRSSGGTIRLGWASARACSMAACGECGWASGSATRAAALASSSWPRRQARRIRSAVCSTQVAASKASPATGAMGVAMAGAGWAGSAAAGRGVGMARAMAFITQLRQSGKTSLGSARCRPTLEKRGVCRPMRAGAGVSLPRAAPAPATVAPGSARGPAGRRRSRACGRCRPRPATGSAGPAGRRAR